MAVMSAIWTLLVTASLHASLLLQSGSIQAVPTTDLPRVLAGDSSARDASESRHVDCEGADDDSASLAEAPRSELQIPRHGSIWRVSQFRMVQPCAGQRKLSACRTLQSQHVRCQV
jgi:hypothetical protein